MEYALVGFAAIVVATMVYVLCRKDRLMVAERDSWREERRELLLRIQAPEQAVIQQITERAPVSPPAVSWDDDESYWTARESLEQLADRAMAAELAS